MAKAETYLQKLLVTQPLRESSLRSVISALRLPAGSRGLDAGCGIGLPAALLADAVGPSGHVTGVDIDPEFISYASRVAKDLGLSERTSFRQGNVNRLPFDDSSFDWAWSVDCVGYGPGNPLSLIRELARVVRPGGTVAILVYSSQQLLPGYPRLEARLNATSSGIAPFTDGMRPERHYYRAIGWFRDAGLEEILAQAFVDSVCAPLSDKIRNALIALLDMRWSNLQSELTPEDWKEYKRLCDPESPDLIIDCRDYYAFFTYSLFHGRVPE